MKALPGLKMTKELLLTKSDKRSITVVMTIINYIAKNGVDTKG